MTIVRNVHMYPSPLIGASRILKQTRTLAEHNVFDRVELVGIWEPGVLEEERLDACRTIRRLRLWFGNLNRFPFEGLKFLELVIRAVWRFRHQDVRVVNCHSLSMLPVGALLKVLWRKKLIYDTHELETETTAKHGLRRFVARILEAALIPLADEVVVVNHSIGGWYRERYGLPRIHVVRNIPYRVPLANVQSNILRRDLNIPEGDLIFLYLGNLRVQRGVDKFLALFQKVRKDRHFVLMGSGELEGKIVSLARESPNIHFHPPVPTDRVLEYSSGADVGVHFIENTCLNHYYCLPNKLFEYLLAGVPVMVRAFPELGGVVRTYECGWILSDDEGQWLNLLTRLTREEVEEKRRGALRARDSFGWEHEEKAYLEAFSRIPTLQEKAT